MWSNLEKIRYLIPNKETCKQAFPIGANNSWAHFGTELRRDKPKAKKIENSLLYLGNEIRKKTKRTRTGKFQEREYVENYKYNKYFEPHNNPEYSSVIYGVGYLRQGQTEVWLPRGPWRGWPRAPAGTPRSPGCPTSPPGSCSPARSKQYSNLSHLVSKIHNNRRTELKKILIFFLISYKHSWYRYLDEH